MDPLVVLVAVLAVYRLTMLVTADEITRPLRDRLVVAAPGRFDYLLECPWCASIYVAPPVMASAYWWSDGWGWWLTAGSLAASAVTGIIASYASP